METQSKKLALLITLALFVININSAWSQPGRGKHQNFRERDRMECMDENHPMMKSLSEEQKSKIKEIRLAHQKEMIQTRNILGEKKAKLRSLQTAENPNIKEMDLLIEEIGHIKIDEAKKRNQVHQSIRALLTDEQRIQFDSRMGRKMGRMERNDDDCRMKRRECLQD